ncbi:MAG: RAD55 family ATPase [Bacillota bacterium]
MPHRLLTGLPGLDTVLGGGLMPHSCVLLTGAAGTGKTTLGLQFLCAGAEVGEGGAYITFEQFPDQIYRDALQFGWDLQALEQAGKLRVICMSPEAFLDDAIQPDGLLEELKAELNLSRVVIDSLNLVLMDQPEAAWRKSFYLLRNVLQRLEITSLFLHEVHEGESSRQVQFFVADTVIRLTFDCFDEHRLRHLEVLKHRGSDMVSGRLVFVFTDRGLKVLPILSQIPNPLGGESVPTGLRRLDECLNGGLRRGSSLVMNVNSKGHYRYLYASLIAAHINKGYLWQSGPSAKSFNELEYLMSLFGVDIPALAAEGRWISSEMEGRYVPPELVDYVNEYTSEAAADPTENTSLVEPLVTVQKKAQAPWLITMDLNVVLRNIGPEAMELEWMRLMAAVREHGHTLIALCNFDEMGAAFTSFVQRTANSVLRVWYDGRYQYLQVQKSPTGRVSAPMVIEYTSERPFMEVW